MTERYLVAITERLENYDRGYILSADPLTAEQFSAALDASKHGPCPAVGHTAARLAGELVGVLEYTKKGGAPRPVLIERGPLSEQEFRAQCLKVWGHLA